MYVQTVVLGLVTLLLKGNGNNKTQTIYHVQDHGNLPHRHGSKIGLILILPVRMSSFFWRLALTPTRCMNVHKRS